MRYKIDEERHKEWLKHFGEEMAKLPEGTHCCGNCRFHLPSVMWHAVTCSKHHGGSGVRAEYAEEYTGCPDWDAIIQTKGNPVGFVYKARTYPFVLPYDYVLKLYRREGSWWGRLLNDIECLIIKRIFYKSGLWGR